MASIDPQLLCKAMDLAEVSTEQLAEKLGISRSYMHNIRGGFRSLERKPQLRREIARALGIPVHWIESQEDDEQVAS